MLQALSQLRVVSEHFQTRADLGEMRAEVFVGGGNAAEGAVLAQHDDPRLEHHQHQHGDDHPGVHRHRVEQETEAAETETGLFFIDTVRHQFRLGALRSGIGQQQRGRTGDFRQAQFIDSAHERLERTFVQIGTDGHDRIERRHRLGQHGAFATVDV